MFSSNNIQFNGQPFNSKLKDLEGGSNNAQVNLGGMKLVWNFPDASGKLNAQALSGHLVASQADVSITGGNFEGGIVAKTVNSDSEGHFYAFNKPGTSSSTATDTTGTSTTDTGAKDSTGTGTSSTTGTSTKDTGATGLTSTTGTNISGADTAREDTNTSADSNTSSPTSLSAPSKAKTSTSGEVDTGDFSMPLNWVLFGSSTLTAIFLLAKKKKDSSK